MKIVFKLSEDKTRNLEQLKQFDICLQATRLMAPNIRIVIQIPAGWWYPTTWQGLERLGVKITRDEVEVLAEDIVLEGTHVPITSLDKRPLACIPEHQVEVADEVVDFPSAIGWLEARRNVGNRIWLYIDPNNPHYWNSRPQETKLPLIEWLQWAYWRKSQPPIHANTRTFAGFGRRAKIHPPVKQSM